MEEAPDHIGLLKFTDNLIRKSRTFDELKLQETVETVIQEFMSLFKHLRTYEQKSLAEIWTLRGRERMMVHWTHVDLALRVSGFPEVLLITVTNSVNSSTIAHEFFDFYYRVVGIKSRNISKADLVRVIETLGMSDRLGKQVMLNILTFYKIKTAEIFLFLQEGVAAERILNPETSAEFFNLFKEEKKDYCDFTKVLPLFMCLFIESEICNILKYRGQYLSVLGISDKLNSDSRDLIFDDVMPFTKPHSKKPDDILFFADIISPDTEYDMLIGNTSNFFTPSGSEQGIDYLPPDYTEFEYAIVKETPDKAEINKESDGVSMIKIAYRVLKADFNADKKILTFRNIQTILNEFRISGFSVSAT